MRKEGEKAKQLSCANPVWPSKDDTDTAFDEAVEFLVKKPNAALIVASHNEDSAMRASLAVQQNALPSNTEKVCFAQLYGMCDHLSLALAKKQHSVFKYVPYGPISKASSLLLTRQTTCCHISLVAFRRIKALWLLQQRTRSVHCFVVKSFAG
jgi:proline dehydrogenase